MPLVRGAGFERRRERDGPKRRRRQRALRREIRARRRRRSASASRRRRVGAVDIEIVGVVRDAKYSEVKADTPPQLFMPRETGAVSRRDELLPAQRPRVRASCARPSSRCVARQDANLPLMEFPHGDRAGERERVPRPLHEHAGRRRWPSWPPCSRASASTACSRTVSSSGCARSGCASRSAPRRRTCAAWC